MHSSYLSHLFAISAILNGVLTHPVNDDILPPTRVIARQVEEASLSSSSSSSATGAVTGLPTGTTTEGSVIPVEEELEEDPLTPTGGITGSRKVTTTEDDDFNPFKAFGGGWQGLLAACESQTGSTPLITGVSKLATTDTDLEDPVDPVDTLGETGASSSSSSSSASATGLTTTPTDLSRRSAFRDGNGEGRTGGRKSGFGGPYGGGFDRDGVVDEDAVVDEDPTVVDPVVGAVSSSSSSSTTALPVATGTTTVVKKRTFGKTGKGRWNKADFTKLCDAVSGSPSLGTTSLSLKSSSGTLSTTGEEEDPVLPASADETPVVDGDTPTASSSSSSSSSSATTLATETGLAKRRT